MTFEQALQAMRRGEKVNRPPWEGFFLSIEDGEMYAYKGVDSHPVDELPIEEILATDWQIVPSETDQKLHEFNGA